MLLGSLSFLWISGCEGPKEDTALPPENTAPSAPVVAISPPHPVPGGADAQCVVVQPSVDGESDEVEYEIAWTRNGGSVPATGHVEHVGDVLTMQNVEIGDLLGCTATPDDGDLKGEPGSASASVRAAFVGWGGGDVDVDQADFIFEGEGIGTQAGRIFLPAGDVDGDGLPDILVNAHKNESVDFFAGKAFLILGSSLSVPGVFPLSQSDYGFEGEGLEDFAGHGLDAAGDVDGDGLDDFVVSAYLHDWDGWERGRVYVQYGGDLGDPSHRSLSEASLSIRGEENGDRLGHSVCGAGDMDGDGLADIAAGAYGNDHHGPRSGKGYIFLGDSLQGETVLDAGDADHIFYGQQASGRAGHGVSGVGDVDGDGLSDILMAARFEDTAVLDAGVTYLVQGGNLGVPGSRPVNSVVFAVEGEGEGDTCCVIFNLGDLDGDGGSDLLLGSHDNDTMERDGGAAYVVLSSTVAQGGILPLGEADFRLYGVFGGDETGHGVSGAGDVDGDGVIDLLLGAPGHTPSASNPAPSAGRAYLVSGRDLLDSDQYTLENAMQTFSSDRSMDLVGWGVFGGINADINLDGVPDLFVGSANEDPDGIGRAFLFLTPSGTPL